MSLPSSNLVTRVADAIQVRGRKAGSGEPLFFDRFNLERVIREAIEAETSLGSLTKADGRSPQGEDEGQTPGPKT